MIGRLGKPDALDGSYAVHTCACWHWLQLSWRGRLHNSWAIRMSTARRSWSSSMSTQRNMARALSFSHLFSKLCECMFMHVQAKCQCVVWGGNVPRHCRDVNGKYAFGARDNKSDSHKVFSGASLKDASNGPGSQCQLCCFSELCDLGKLSHL